MSRRSVMGVLLAASLGVGVACAEARKLTDGAEAAPVPTLPAGYNPAASLAPLVEALSPAVVNLVVEQEVELPQMSGNPFFPFFGDQGWPGAQSDEQGQSFRTQEGQGSGFLISEDGYILTNNHVVDDATKVKVRLADEREFEATVIGTDSRTDIALVRIDAGSKLPYVALGSSDALRVGDWVVAIGNPFGLSHTVTAGIVSAKGRVIGAGPYDDFIQTDASINPGNSGGPLFDTAGNVVGINTAIVGRASGIGFAVPIDMVKPVIDELKASGRVARGWMGVGLSELDADLARGLELDDGQDGVVIRQVYPGFPGAKAGLEPGDVVVALDDQVVEDSEGLIRAIGGHKPGDTVRLDVLRDGKRKEIKVELAERPDEAALARGTFLDEQGDDAATASSDGGPLARVGIAVGDARRYGAQADGLVVTGVDSQGAANGKLQPGDVLVEVNGQKISSKADLGKALGKREDVAVFIVQRDRMQQLIAVPLDGGAR